MFSRKHPSLDAIFSQPQNAKVQNLKCPKNITSHDVLEPLKQVILASRDSGKSKGGLSKEGLGPKGANWAQKGPFGAISALPPWLCTPWGAEELVPIGPEKAPIGPEKVPICRFSQVM